VALLLLRQSGQCFLSLPEHLFDEDHPGHYLRRVKSVSLSIPSVVGPYTSINCRLSLVRSEVRINTNMAADGSYPRQRGNSGPDNRFKDVNVEGIDGGDFALPEQTAAIVTSHAQGDSGLFETNLRDERYLPFEGAGAISIWRIELPKEVNRFDLASVADVVIHLRYTARDGGPSLRSSVWEETFGSAAPAGLPIPPAGTLGAPHKLMRLFSVREEFSAAWHRFLHPAESGSSPLLDLNLSRDRFPFRSPDLNLVLKTMTFLFVTESSASAEGLVGKLSFVDPASGASTEATPRSSTFTSDPALASLATCEYVPQGSGRTGLWRFEVGAADNVASTTILGRDDATAKVRLNGTTVLNLFILCSYEVESAI